MFKKGDKVQLKLEFQDEGDELFERFCVEDEDGGRVLIVTIIPKFSINPQEIVLVEWLIKV
jgi:hypothetical protein